MGKEMSKILPGVFLGRLENAQDDKEMMANCITHVLSVHEPVKQKLHKSKSYKYYDINVKDEESACISKYFTKSNDFIHYARCNGGNVLIHCLAGVSRAPTIVIAYLMTVYDISMEQALNCLRVVRRNIKPNVGFIRQLEEFQQQELTAERQRVFQQYGVWTNIEDDKKMLNELLQKFEENEKHNIDNSIDSSLSNEFTNSTNYFQSIDHDRDTLYLNQDFEGLENLSPSPSSEKESDNNNDDDDDDDDEEEEDMLFEENEEEKQQTEIPGSISISEAPIRQTNFENKIHSTGFPNENEFNVNSIQVRPRANTRLTRLDEAKVKNSIRKSPNEQLPHKVSQAIEINIPSPTDFNKSDKYGRTAPPTLSRHFFQ